MTKVSKLKGKQLDYWVAKAQEWEQSFNKNLFDGNKDRPMWVSKKETYKGFVDIYTPSTDGGQCFDLLTSNDFETYNYYCTISKKTRSYAHVVGYKLTGEGDTLNIAICRAYVASVFGDEVSE